MSKNFNRDYNQYKKNREESPVEAKIDETAEVVEAKIDSEVKEPETIEIAKAEEAPDRKVVKFSGTVTAKSKDLIFVKTKEGHSIFMPLKEEYKDFKVGEIAEFEVEE